MARTLKDLLLALLNATLILLALCLFLGWKLMQSVDGISTNLGQTMQRVTPLRDEAMGIREELAALRGDLQDLRTDGALDPAARVRVSALLARMNDMEDRLAVTQARFSDLADNPGILIDRAINTTINSAADRLQHLRGCEPAV